MVVEDEIFNFYDSLNRGTGSLDDRPWKAPRLCSTEQTPDVRGKKNSGTNGEVGKVNKIQEERRTVDVEISNEDRRKCNGSLTNENGSNPLRRNNPLSRKLKEPLKDKVTGGFSSTVYENGALNRELSEHNGRTKTLSDKHDGPGRLTGISEGTGVDDHTNAPSISDCGAAEEPILKIPGPVGELLLERKGITNQIGNGCEGVKEPNYGTKQDVKSEFCSDPWLAAMDVLDAKFTQGSWSVSWTTLSFLTSEGRGGRVDQVVGIVTAIQRTDFGDAQIELKDHTATVKGMLPGRFFADEDFSAKLTVGAVLVLKGPVVFSPQPGTQYLNITERNVVHVFPAEPKTRSADTEAPETAQGSSPKNNRENELGKRQNRGSERIGPSGLEPVNKNVDMGANDDPFNIFRLI